MDQGWVVDDAFHKLRANEYKKKSTNICTLCSTNTQTNTNTHTTGVIVIVKHTIEKIVMPSPEEIFSQKGNIDGGILTFDQTITFLPLLILSLCSIQFAYENCPIQNMNILTYPVLLLFGHAFNYCPLDTEHNYRCKQMWALLSTGFRIEIETDKHKF